MSTTWRSQQFTTVYQLDSVPDLLSNFLEDIENDPSINDVKLSRLLAKTMAKHGFNSLGADLSARSISIDKRFIFCVMSLRDAQMENLYLSPMTTKDLENKLNV